MRRCAARSRRPSTSSLSAHTTSKPLPQVTVLATLPPTTLIRSSPAPASTMGAAPLMMSSPRPPSTSTARFSESVARNVMTSSPRSRRCSHPADRWQPARRCPADPGCCCRPSRPHDQVVAGSAAKERNAGRPGDLIVPRPSIGPRETIGADAEDVVSAAAVDCAGQPVGEHVVVAGPAKTEALMLNGTTEATSFPSPRCTTNPAAEQKIGAPATHPAPSCKAPILGERHKVREGHADLEAVDLPGPRAVDGADRCPAPPASRPAAGALIASAAVRVRRAALMRGT